MTNPFEDIERFAAACDQPASPENYKMYLGLIDEEYDELLDAVNRIEKYLSKIFTGKGMLD